MQSTRHLVVHIPHLRRSGRGQVHLRRLQCRFRVLRLRCENDVTRYHLHVGVAEPAQGHHGGVVGVADRGVGFVTEGVGADGAGLGEVFEEATVRTGHVVAHFLAVC